MRYCVVMSWHSECVWHVGPRPRHRRRRRRPSWTRSWRRCWRGETKTGRRFSSTSSTSRSGEFRGPCEILLWGARAGIHLVSARRVLRKEPGAVQRCRHQREGARDVRAEFPATDESPRRAREGAGQRDRRHRRPPAPSDLQSLIQQTREPQFVSSAYLLKFKFEGGQLRAGRPRDDRRAHGAAHRVLPDQALFRRSRDARGSAGEPGRRPQIARTTRTAKKCSGS